MTTHGCDCSCVSPAECFPAGRRLLQLLQLPDGAAAEAERRADRFRQPTDRREERSEEPHAPLGGRAPTLPAVWTGLRRQCEYMIESTSDCLYIIVVVDVANSMTLTKFRYLISSCSSAAGEERRRRIRRVCCFPRNGRLGQERRSAWRKLYTWRRPRWPDSGGRSGPTPCER